MGATTQPDDFEPDPFAGLTEREALVAHGPFAYYSADRARFERYLADGKFGRRYSPEEITRIVAVADATPGLRRLTPDEIKAAARGNGTPAKPTLGEMRDRGRRLLDARNSEGDLPDPHPSELPARVRAEAEALWSVATPPNGDGRPPPVAPGHVRLYRGEGVHKWTSDDWGDAPTGGASHGRWFTEDLSRAQGYATGIGGMRQGYVKYVDVPDATAHSARVDDPAGSTFVLPEQYAERASELTPGSADAAREVYAERHAAMAETEATRARLKQARDALKAPVADTPPPTPTAGAAHPAPHALPAPPIRALLAPGPGGPPAPTPSAPTAPLPAATPAPSPPPRVHRPATAAAPGRSDSSRLPRIALALAGLGVVGAAAFAMMVASLMGGLNAQDSSTSSPSALAVADIPPDILPIYLQAGQSRGLDWAYLAAIGKIETDHGRSTAPGVKSGVNAFGCCAGPMQFSVIGAGGGTWGAYGVDGNHDGQTSVYDPADAIPAAADYLKASGAPGDWDRAIFAYNHAAWYVADVKRQAQLYRDAAESPTDLQTGGTTTQRLPNGAPWLVAIPGTTARCDSRIARDVMALMERYKLALGDCYAASGHEPDGEHPLGLATDLTPGSGGSWALVERLARDLGWNEGCAASGCAGTLPPPFRFIGYNGFPGHGDPAHAGANAHLHLSWQHSAATAGQPATVVQTLLKPGGP